MGVPSQTRISIMDPAIISYRDEYNLDVIGLIPSGIFGPNDIKNIDHAPMLPATILNSLLCKRTNSKLNPRLGKW